MDLSDDSLYVDVYLVLGFSPISTVNFLMQKDVFSFQALNSAEVLQSWLRPSTFKRGSAQEDTICVAGVATLSCVCWLWNFNGRPVTFFHGS